MLIDGEELKLTFSESRQLARVRNIKINKDDINSIFEASTGWITGTILILEYLRQPGNQKTISERSSGQVLYDYIAQEIFSAFDENSNL